jgi:ribonuclease HII
VSAAVIDEIGILAATKRAMRLAVRRLSLPPGFLLIDAVSIDLPGTPQLGIIRGDLTVLSIAAASILAKVHRDALMARWDERLPGYAFASHVGYGTPEHLEALAKLGPSPLHRKTFAPVRARLQVGIDLLSAPVADPSLPSRCAPR